MYLFSGLSKILVILFRVLVVLSVLLLVIVNGFTVSAQTQTDSNEPTTNTLSTIFPACKFADTGVASFLECASQITFFILVVAIIYAFLKLAYMAINGLLFAGGVSSDFYKMIGESLRNLVVGILFVGMPVAILTVVDPLARVLSFRFLEELNLGPEARLIEPAVKGKGCNDFNICVSSCKKNHRNSSECFTKCKQNYSSCRCAKFIDDQGNGLDTKEYKECLFPPSKKIQGGGNNNGGNGGGVSGSDGSFTANGVTVKIDRNNWLATAPNQECRLSRYGNNIPDIERNWLVEYDFSFLNRGIRPRSRPETPKTAMVNKEAIPGFECVKQKLNEYKLNNTTYRFPKLAGDPPIYNNDNIDYQFQFSNTTGRPLNNFSFHPFGLAIDLNVPRNCGDYDNLCGPDETVRRDMPEKVVEIFNSCGFFWGGDWQLPAAKNDPMHFEFHAIPCPNQSRSNVT